MFLENFLYMDSSDNRSLMQRNVSGCREPAADGMRNTRHCAEPRTTGQFSILFLAGPWTALKIGELLTGTVNMQSKKERRRGTCGGERGHNNRTTEQHGGIGELAMRGAIETNVAPKANNKLQSNRKRTDRPEKPRR